MNKKKLYESIMKNVAVLVKKAINEGEYYYHNDELTTLWNNLIEEGIATEAELQLVTDINGYSIVSLNDIIYARTGYHDWNQYKGYEDVEEEENDEDLY